MTTFQRFQSVARWDMTVNRHFYTKVLFIALAVSALPTLLFFGYWAIRYSVSDAVLYKSGPLELAEQATGFILNFAGMACWGNMFYTMHNRRARAAELMLPASNIEKFLWRAAIVFFGAVVLCNVWQLLLDVIRYLFVGGVAGFEVARLGFVESWSQLLSSLSAPNPVSNYLLSHPVSFTLFAWSLGFIGTSLFALLSAFNYRRGFLLGLLVSIILFVVLVVFLMFFAFLAFGAANANMMGMIGGNMLLIALFNCLLIALLWRGAYKLYARAQLTTRRNP